jgi:hypothetical protein
MFLCTMVIDDLVDIIEGKKYVLLEENIEKETLMFVCRHSKVCT